MKIYSTYHAGNADTFDMPEGRVWADVESYFIKWDVLYLFFKDGTTADIDLLIDPQVDTKRPISTEIEE